MGTSVHGIIHVRHVAFLLPLRLTQPTKHPMTKALAFRHYCPWEWGGWDWTSRFQQVQVERYRLPCHDPVHWHTNRMAIVKRVLCACYN